jgi:hypothetical protein
LKVSGHNVESERQVPGNVLEKDPFRLAFSDDAADVRPEMSRIVSSESFAGLAERLAGVACSNAIHNPTPRSPVEGNKVTPDRKRSQGTCFHLRNHKCGGEGFPLHSTDAASADSGETDSALEAEQPGT